LNYLNQTQMKKISIVAKSVNYHTVTLKVPKDISEENAVKLLELDGKDVAYGREASFETLEHYLLKDDLDNDIVAFEDVEVRETEA